MKWLPWAALAIFVFAYRQLAGLDPAADSRLEGAERFLFDTTSSSPALIFVLAAFFLFSRRQRFFDSVGHQSAPIQATLALIPSAILFGWACYVELGYLLVSSLSLLLLGGSLLVGGRPAFRVMLFPALFLFLALPLPTVFVNEISYSMQTTNAGITEWILDTVGFRAASLGDHIYYDRRIFHVIEACTGLRTVQTLFMAALVYIEIFGRRGPRAWLLVLSSPLVGLVINEIRILSIVLNPHAAISAVHTLQGLVMIAVGVLLLACVDGLLGLFRWKQHEQSGEERVANVETFPRRGWLLLISLGVFFSMISIGLPVWEAPNLLEPRISRLAAEHDGWAVTERLPLENDFLGSTAFSQTLLRTYVKDNDQVKIFIGIDDRLRGGNRAKSPKTIVPGGGWVIDRQGVGGLPGGRWYIAHSRRERHLIYHKNDHMDSFTEELLRSLFGLGRGPLRRLDRSTVTRLSTAISDRPGGLDEARERLDRFLESFREPLRQYQIANSANR